MRRLVLVTLLGLHTLSGALPAQEKITLAVAETVQNAEYRLESFHPIFDNPATGTDEGSLTIVLRGQNNEPVVCSYGPGTTPTGTFLNTALNKANLSSAYNNNATTGSLKQRIYHRLVVMGESTAICGKTITGSLAGAVP